MKRTCQRLAVSIHTETVKLANDLRNVPKSAPQFDEANLLLRDATEAFGAFGICWRQRRPADDFMRSEGM